MKFALFILALAFGLAACSDRNSAGNQSAQSYKVKGVVREVKASDKILIIRHEKIPDYMEAMTMPFKVRELSILTNVTAGDEINFVLHVTSDESWIDQVTRTGTRIPVSRGAPVESTNAPTIKSGRHPLLDYAFTNEFGQPMRLSQFQGQALGITFFFTRCPVPDFCPRLSKNFEEASQKLSALTNGPTNWHFLSITFDAEFDTPAVLLEYGKRYRYDSNHWSFLTGPAKELNDLAKLSGVSVEKDGGLFNHGFSTMIIDAKGDLQMRFPISGNLSDAIVSEMLKAAKPATNGPAG